MPYILEKGPRVPEQLAQRKKLSQTSQTVSNIPKPVKLQPRHFGEGVNHASRPSVCNIPDTPVKIASNSYKLPLKDKPVQKRKSIEINSEIPALELKPFAEQPVVDFGEVCVDQTRVSYVTIRNLQNLQQHLSVKSFPRQDSGFSMDSVDLFIAPKTEIFAALAWTPKGVGPVRESITLQDVNKSVFRIVMIGRAVRPKLKSCIKSTLKVNARVQSRPTPSKTNRFSPPKGGRRINPDKTQLLFSPRSRNLLNKGVDIKPLTKLKATARRRDSGQIVLNILARNDEAMAIQVQSIWRMILAKRCAILARHEREVKLEAALKIQSFWRMVLAKRQFDRLVALDNIAKKNEAMAIKLQSIWRMILAKRQADCARHERDIRIQATIRIQSFWKMILAKRRFDRLVALNIIAKKNEAMAIQVQSIWRMLLAKRQAALAKRERENRLKAALRIQSFWRMILAKRELNRLIALAIIAKKNEAMAIQVQSFWRMLLAKRLAALAKRERENRLKAALRIQSFWRMILAKREFDRLMALHIIAMKNEAMAIKVQSFWRMVLAKRQAIIAKREREIKLEATLRIQALWRMILAKRQFGEHLDARLDAISRVKRRWAL